MKRLLKRIQQYPKTPLLNHLYEEIIKANPTVPKDPVIESGIKLKIPVLDTSQTIQFELPPWKK